ncbi:MAG: AAA family ATPase [Nitrospiraceae bacterium]|nr:AAA family ATPase [Nitrospiraceae bacterium]
MRKHEFSRFWADDANRLALETCQAIAELRPISPQPIILIGDPGVGKTHLLRAVAAGLCLREPAVLVVRVSAECFPDSARDLLEHPAEVPGTARCVLLVDQLERFAGHVEELESLIHLFMESNHCVLIASRAHPDRLPNLTDGLRVLLRGGNAIFVGTFGVTAERSEVVDSGTLDGEWLSGTEPREEVPVEDLSARIEALEAERDALLDQVRRLSDELEASREVGTRAKKEVYSLVDQTDALLSDMVAEQERQFRTEQEQELRGQEMARLRRECEHARTEAHQAQEAVSALRGELAEAVRGREEALARLAALEAQLRVPAPPKTERTRDTRRLGEILCDNGDITQPQLTSALCAQTTADHTKLGAILMQKGFAAEDVVVRALAQQLGFEFMRIDHGAIQPDAAQLVSGRMAKQHRCMPLHAASGELALAMSNPTDLVAIDDIEHTTNLHVRVVAAPSSDIAKAHQHFYVEGNGKRPQDEDTWIT